MKRFLFPLAALLVAVTLLTGCGTTRWMSATITPELTAPPSGQVLVNIIRPSHFGGAQDFPVFDATDEKLIGNLEGKQRMQYVCAPGDRVFVGWGERKSGVIAKLAANQTYDLICDVGMGFWTASVALRPLYKNDERRPKLPTWEADCRRLVFTPSADATQWQAGKLADLRRIRQEFQAEPHDRVLPLAESDHR